MTNQEELRERYRQSRAKSLALFAAIDARRRAESRAAEDTAHLRSHDDDRILRRDVEIDAIEDLEKWRRDADAAQAAREFETRRRAHVEAKAMHERQQRSDAIASLQRDVDQVGANLTVVTRATGEMGEAIRGQFDDMAHAITLLNERLIAAESKAQLAEVRVREVQDELRRTVVELSVQKSKVADLDLALKQAIFDRKVAEAAPMLHSNVN
jgi:hypothetical protein